MNLSNSWGSNHFYINVRFHKRNICLFESLQLLHVSLVFFIFGAVQSPYLNLESIISPFFRTPYSSLRELNESYFLGIWNLYANVRKLRHFSINKNSLKLFGNSSNLLFFQMSWATDVRNLFCYEKYKRSAIKILQGQDLLYMYVPFTERGN